MTYSQEKDDIWIRDFSPLTDGGSNVTGYYITFNDSEAPAGYLLLSLISGEPSIIEFAFEGPGIIDFEASEISADGNSGTEDIILTGPGELYLYGGGGKYYSVYDHEMVDDGIQTVISPRSSISSGILDWSEAGIKNSSVFKISNFGSGGDYWIVEDFDHPDGGCTPAAGTNILWYWCKKRYCKSIDMRVPFPASDFDMANTIYTSLRTGMKTDDKQGTYGNMIINGFEFFFVHPADSNGPWNYKYFDSGTSFSSYKTALNGNCPILFNMATKPLSNGKRDGHSVMAMGYAQNNSGTNYLMVMDGWYKYGRFIKKGTFYTENGDKIWVKN